MSSRPGLTNLPPSDMIMDHHRGRDPRYWCLPPFRGDPKRAPVDRGYRYHLVWQGRTVGTFDTWAAASASVTGYPSAGNKGFHTIDECIEAWQTMCPLGVHPHPVEPTTPLPLLEPTLEPTIPVKIEKSQSPRTALPSGSKKKARSVKDKEEDTPTPTASSRSGPHVNFAIQGQGVISSSPVCAQRQYEELQLLGEQPDILVTRSFAMASQFALDEETDL
ncbi:hypothetical protein B0H14DRAFT_3458020 [Mycena olivaceomarginata]|nr:hypothetical protein B0H14DRAFT_3458020 [Mycena olivaceomarginata]